MKCWLGSLISMLLVLLPHWGVHGEERISSSGMVPWKGLSGLEVPFFEDMGTMEIVFLPDVPGVEEYLGRGWSASLGRKLITQQGAWAPST